MVGADSQLSRPDLVTSRARYRPTAKRVRSKSDCDGGNYLKWTSDIKGLQGGFSMSESGGTTVVDPPPLNLAVAIWGPASGSRSGNVASVPGQYVRPP